MLLSLVAQRNKTNLFLCHVQEKVMCDKKQWLTLGEILYLQFHTLMRIKNISKEVVVEVFRPFTSVKNTPLQLKDLHSQPH